MDSIVNLLANEENGRLLVILVAIYCFYVSTKSQMKDIRHSINELRTELKGEINELRAEMNAKIDGLRSELKGEIKELKYNDFAHLSSAFEALTYVLEKKGYLSKEDKEFVDSRLATV